LELTVTAADERRVKQLRVRAIEAPPEEISSESR
jgi:hypothetical protein